MKRKKLKGLSLMEIIISIAVYAIIALLMAEIMGCINATMTSTSRLNERLDSEALLVDNKETNPGSTPFRNPNRVNVIAHIGDRTSAGLALDQGTELIPATSSEDDRIAFGDNQNSTHFRFMDFDNRDLDITFNPDTTFTFKIKLTHALDDASFAALPGNNLRKVTGIQKVVVRSTEDFYDGPDPDNSGLTKSKEFTIEDLTNSDSLKNGADFITLQFPYYMSTDPIVVTVEIIPNFEPNIHFDMNPDEIKYLKDGKLSFVQFYETVGSKKETYAYFNAIYEFDGQEITPCDYTGRPVLVTDGT